MSRESELIRDTPTPDGGKQRSLNDVDAMEAEMLAMEEQWGRQDSEVGLTLPSPTKMKFEKFEFEESGFYDTD